MEFFIILSTTRRKREGESKQSYLAPVLNWNSSVRCPSFTTLQCSPSYEFRMMMTIFSNTHSIMSKRIPLGSHVHAVKRFLTVKKVD
ncbi:unnamed protein product, partial [Schistosoma mattheei]|uniref:Uncharacterized protein n=1 Tax=Schistosoma mattheei TaxID=31246 RepID=A0AA85BD73_9TREM